MYTSIVIKGTACWRRGSKCVRRVYLWGSVNFEVSGKYASMVRVDEWNWWRKWAAAWIFILLPCYSSV